MNTITIYFSSTHDITAFDVANEDGMYDTSINYDHLTATITFNSQEEAEEYRQGLSSEFFNITSWK